jgi:hypothetical protein
LEGGNNAAVSPLSAAVCVLPPLAAPANVAAVARTDGAIVVTWEDRSADEMGFEVWRVPEGGSSVYVARTGAGATSFADMGGVPGTTYCYQVRAYRGVVVSGFTTAACARVLAPLPRTPRLTSVAPVNSAAAGMYWTEGSEGLARIERSTDGGASWVVAGTAYSGFQGHFVDYGIESERTACYRMLITNVAGEGAPSNTLCTTPPAAPTQVVMVTVAASTVDLSWHDASAVEDGYEIRALVYDCWQDWDGQQYCDTYEYAVATLPAGSTSYRIFDWYAIEWRIYPMKDGGYGSAGVVATP